MKANEFLDLARELLAKHDEASDRTAISRAYTALVVAARQWLSERGISVAKGEPIYRGLFNRLYHSKSAALRIVARDLHELRVQRNEADYNMTRKLPSATAADQVGRSSAAMAMLETIEPADFPGIVAAVREFEKTKSK